MHKYKAYKILYYLTADSNDANTCKNMIPCQKKSVKIYFSKTRPKFSIGIGVRGAYAKFNLTLLNCILQKSINKIHAKLSVYPETK